jgi:hypothetical protein
LPEHCLSIAWEWPCAHCIPVGSPGNTGTIPRPSGYHFFTIMLPLSYLSVLFYCNTAVDINPMTKRAFYMNKLEGCSQLGYMSFLQQMDQIEQAPQEFDLIQKEPPGVGSNSLQYVFNYNISLFSEILKCQMTERASFSSKASSEIFT